MAYFYWAEKHKLLTNFQEDIELKFMSILRNIYIKPVIIVPQTPKLA